MSSGERLSSGTMAATAFDLPDSAQIESVGAQNEVTRSARTPMPFSRLPSTPCHERFGPIIVSATEESLTALATGGPTAGSGVDGDRDGSLSRAPARIREGSIEPLRLPTFERKSPAMTAPCE